MDSFVVLAESRSVYFSLAFLFFPSLLFGFVDLGLFLLFVLITYTGL